MNSLYLNVFVDGVTDLLVCRFRTVVLIVDVVVMRALGDDNLVDVGIRGVGDGTACPRVVLAIDEDHRHGGHRQEVVDEVLGHRIAESGC